jgi:hypothetical protein
MCDVPTKGPVELVQLVVEAHCQEPRWLRSVNCVYLLVTFSPNEVGATPALIANAICEVLALCFLTSLYDRQPAVRFDKD